MKSLQRIIEWLRLMACPSLGFALLMVSIAQAQGTNLPAIAQNEIARRGNHIEMTGTIRSGLISAALAPPEDDSAKWFITLVIKTGDADCEYMRHVIATGPDMKPWVDAGSPNLSTTHYQIRSVDDKTQADWLSPLQPAIKEFGLPLIVLQPPKNGRFGPSATIVKLLHGPCTGKQLSEKLRESVIYYVTTIEKRPDGGIGVDKPYSAVKEPDQPVISVAPPFNVPKPDVKPFPVETKPRPNTVPFEWPPSKSEALTIEQIQSACPDASAEFILATIQSKETSLEIVKLKWTVDKLQKSHDAGQVVKQRPAEPLPPVLLPVPTPAEMPVADEETDAVEVKSDAPFFPWELLFGAILLGSILPTAIQLVRERVGKLGGIATKTEATVITPAPVAVPVVAATIQQL